MSANSFSQNELRGLFGGAKPQAEGGDDDGGAAQSEDRKVPLNHDDSPKTPSPFVVETETTKASFFILDKVAQLYPASPNVRAAEKRKPSEEEEAARFSDRLAREKAAKKKQAKDRENEAANRMMITKKGSSGSESGSDSDGEDNKNNDQDRHPERDENESRETSSQAPTLVTERVESATEAESAKVAGRFIYSQTNLATRLGSHSKGSPGVPAAEDDSDDNGEEFCATRMRQGMSFTRSESKITDSTNPTESLNPNNKNSGPALVIRRPLGSRRPSFVCVKEGWEQKQIELPSAEGQDPEDSANQETVQKSPVMILQRRSSSAERKLRAMGHKFRGEQGSIDRSAEDPSYGPAEYSSRGLNDIRSPDQYPNESRSPAEADSTENTVNEILTKTDNNGPQVLDYNSLHASSRIGGMGISSTSPLHNTETLEAEKRKRHVIRAAGPDTPEAGRTEFSVAYPLERALTTISRVCRLDLNKEVFRRQGANKLRVENRVDSEEPHLVVSMELRTVIEGLTHVRIRASKSDKTRTKFATVWTFYDDLVTQLEVLAHDAATNAAVAQRRRAATGGGLVGSGESSFSALGFSQSNHLSPMSAQKEDIDLNQE